MVTRSTLVHSIIHAILATFLFTSLTFNWAFFVGKIYVDYDLLKKNRTINELYPENPEKKK